VDSNKATPVGGRRPRDKLGFTDPTSCINPTTHTKKGAVQFEPPPKRCSFQDAVANFPAEIMHEHPRSHPKIKQYFGSSRGYGNFFKMTKRAAHWNCPAVGLLKDRWPKHSALMAERRRGKTIRADLNHQRL
jgi:hypothetical protein